MAVMDRRLKLHDILCQILGTDHVYFNPPPSKEMQYPAIVYKRDDVDVKRADNTVYNSKVGYEVILIDEDPDSVYLEPLENLPYSRWNRHYESDNLNHDVFVIYY